MNIYPRNVVRMRSPDSKIRDRRALHNLGGRVGRSDSCVDSPFRTYWTMTVLSSAYCLGVSLLARSSVGAKVLGQGVQSPFDRVATEEGGGWDRIGCGNFWQCADAGVRVLEYCRWKEAMHAHARFVGPGEPLDLVVPVLWDDRDGINACRSGSLLESAGGESSRCLYPNSHDENARKQLPRCVGPLEQELTQRDTSASHAD